MKKLGYLFIAVLVTTMLGGICLACNASNKTKRKGKSVTRTQQVGYFSSVEIVGSTDVHFVQGNSREARIVGARHLTELIDLEKSGNTLIIKMKNGKSNFFHSGSDDVTVYLSSPDLVGVTVRGSGDFEADSNIDTDNMKVSVIGSGDVDFKNIICDSFEAVTKGSGDIDAASIDCKDATLTAYGSGDIEASLKNTGKTTASVFGSGDIDLKLYNCDNVACYITGSGDIELKGNANSVHKLVKGSGDVDTSRLSVKGL